MPEMPEVSTIVNALRPYVKGAKIIDIEVYNAKLIKDISAADFTNTLKNEYILDVENLGKHIIFKLSNDLFLISHLRMSGNYSFYNKYHPPMHHDHIILRLDKGFLYYNDPRAFGTFHLRNTFNLYTSKPLMNLGVEPLKLDTHNLWNKIKNRSIAIKNVLLNQNLILGIGNIYANEALWSCKIHPLTPVKALSYEQFNELVLCVGKIMNEATLKGGSSIQSYSSLNGVKGTYQNELKVHGRENLNCLRCQNRLQKIWVGGRGSVFCSECQKEKNV
ncbi:bifunctional DNA-formamidopyrimidine glycosylase/DNA-(apurinic or apyrimidinic site) lyase [Mycoplasmopsis mucosicanis]|uniref:Bifunctional DNA-formamidopyrimidine glycosylase/DNA-(Apurinic or apyrimidinic site) lyase n=1 Tax=Mycoplasmopsis mucosicanis TaxID=458208 RepID=A0A507SVG3_9BACT|nr:bifunctional DNA-formamidopyrimidine glycosylase/DNA-(apurinic or apyrimidinic site) lyase [Mycoplasmopsis mucosicanis]TQC54184.1 bifunctional DNA-formamidopyrimidine glycosylase/DNA-(apurinic or apyrimidinic site) lyase [Mycoplasmopsis mucosicanis]